MNQQLPFGSKINFSIINYASGIRRWCEDCNGLIDFNQYMIEVTINGSLYHLANDQDFTCPNCGIQVNTTLTFSTEEDAIAHVEGVLDKMLNDGNFVIPLLVPHPIFNTNSGGAKNAHLN